MQNIRNFIVRKSNLQEMEDFRLSSGDREKEFKIWSLLDYMGEWTAPRCLLRSFSQFTLSLHFNPSM